MRSVDVLIVSTKVDIATDAVVQRLRARDISFYRLNTEDYPFESTLVYDPYEKVSDAWLVCNGQAIGTPRSVWYRRFRAPEMPEGTDQGVADFCRQEARAAILGAIMGRQSRWMSRPEAIWAAESKPYQLRIAASLGIPIPRTIVTNDPRAVLTFCAEVGSAIIKPTRSGHFVKEGADYAIYTSQLLPDHLDDLETARWSPSIYQECIPKRFDIRATVVGNECFVAAIDSPSDPAAHVDWRRTDNPDLPHYRYTLPPELVTRLLELMRALRLAFGAIDLVETPSGDYVFLEVNPSGQWLWLDDKLNLGISDAVAAWLAGDATTMT